MRLNALKPEVHRAGVLMATQDGVFGCTSYYLILKSKKTAVAFRRHPGSTQRPTGSSPGRHSGPATSVLRGEGGSFPARVQALWGLLLSYVLLHFVNPLVLFHRETEDDWRRGTEVDFHCGRGRKDPTSNTATKSRRRLSSFVCSGFPKLTSSVFSRLPSCSLHEARDANIKHRRS